MERDPKRLIQNCSNDYLVPEGAHLGGLTLPAVLPQRRPKKRSRGFIRAYAPELENASIDEECYSISLKQPYPPMSRELANFNVLMDTTASSTKLMKDPTNLEA